MADIPGNPSTTATISVGGTVNGSLETVGDSDWFRLSLTAGQEVTVALNGLGFNALEDPYLRIRDSNGNILYENDDAGPGRDSLVSFKAPTSGVYFIDVGSYNGADDGDYQLAVRNYVSPPVGNFDLLAQQLTTDYWDGFPARFNVATGGSLTVNLTGLTGSGQALARQALLHWTDVTGIIFQEVSSGGQIRFDDNEEGAFTEHTTSGNFITSAFVNVSTQWLSDYGTGLNSYSFQTYLHEIGHALGLGHAGNYNDEARYPYEAVYQIDGWPATVMSYFDQNESSYYSSRGFSKAFILTPMNADVIAMTSLYGLATTTRTGNTTYGFNSNAGRDVYNASIHPQVAYAIVDSGGFDTLDYSGYNSNQRIDLNPETYSNVGGLTGNVTIARGTIIENAIGGSGSDVIIGNSANNILTGRSGADIITGGGGADIFRDTLSGLNGDWITDLSPEDKIVFTDANPSTFAYSVSGSFINYSGGSLQFTGTLPGQIIMSAAAGGGVQLTLSSSVGQSDVRDDFNGDGRSDVLWRNEAGALAQWLGQANGTFAYNPAAAYSLPTNWQVAAISDFNGDGRADVLWRNEVGAMSQWLGQSNGGFVYNPNAAYTLPTNWQVAAVGDFNGDSRGDVLWRNETGLLSQWLGQSNGGFVYNAAAAFQVPTDWQVAGAGDFNGDGRDDIVWRSASGVISEWLGQANGSYVHNNLAAYTLPLTWAALGTGDFNGDGRDDMLWRDAGGTLAQWLGQANGTFAYNPNAAYTLPTNWQVASIADFNGDGRDDILWRNETGAMSQWLGQPDGGYLYNAAAAYTLPPNWQSQSDDYWMA